MNVNPLTYDPAADHTCWNLSAYLKKVMQIHSFMFPHQSNILYISVFLCHLAPVDVQASKERESSRKTEIWTSVWKAAQCTLVISACCVYHIGKPLLGKKRVRAKDNIWLTGWLWLAPFLYGTMKDISLLQNAACMKPQNKAFILTNLSWFHVAMFSVLLSGIWRSQALDSGSASTVSKIHFLNQLESQCCYLLKG